MNMWVWEHALFDYNPKRPDSTKKDKTVEVITKADHIAALRRAKAEGKLEGMEEAAILVEAMPMATPYNTALSLRWVVKERREADARAAQIEEGDK